ncbi:penicillin acylase family protein [Burkholderia gladioli]|uniref:penicillin acylase family protein n=1 Tax=Burkholderia gladioli TaxID=28095 RepID=UPI001641C32A|nr:penicillin acylase family protein [Burkholderia gladioli]
MFLSVSTKRRGAIGRSGRLLRHGLAALSLLAGLAGVAAIAGCAGSGPAAGMARIETGGDTVLIRRTADGIPHIEAGDWEALGYGYGYAQASDNLCTMAEAFVTYRGERSRYFGAQGKPAARSTLGEPTNLDSDFFFRLADSAGSIERYRDSQPERFRQLVRGFAAGYDRYLGELRAGGAPGRHLACRAAPWLADITDADIYRRLNAANLAGGEARFVEAIANAHPPAAAQAAQPSARPPASRPVPQPVSPAASQPALQPAPHAARDTAALALAGLDPDQLHVGGHYGIGSNGMAFGRDATGGEPILFGNPHWFWSGPDRFYQAQLTIPGQLDVSGASFLGVPVIMIGFNDEVAWTHTVSGARRFGVFQLRLADDDPTQYLIDGRRIAMRPVTLTVPVRQPDGTLGGVTRTLYTTEYGPVVDLSSWSPALGWTRGQAFALRDVNRDNHRIFQTFLDFGRAGSLDAFVATLKTSAAMPWVNTLVVGRRQPEVWYADVGNVPDVPDQLADRCTTPLGKVVDAKLPGVPFLDGSRAACAWRGDAAAVQRGSMPAAAMPMLARRDFVANMNNSYWLANPAAPLTGFPRVMGIGVAPLDLRARLGLQLAGQAAAPDAAPEQGAAREPLTAAEVRRFTLEGDTLAAALFKRPVLDQVCATARITVARDPLRGASFTPPRTVETADACRILRAWNGAAERDARGAYLWDRFWERAQKIDAGKLYARPFDPADPLHTPAGIRAGEPAVAEAFGAAILAVGEAGYALDATRGETLYLTRDGVPVPLYGGCSGLGYFASICHYGESRANAPISADTVGGNSYLQVVSFDAHGADAYTLLAHSESDDPASPHFSDGTRRYAARRWLRVPFDEHEIAADPQLQVTRLTMPAEPDRSRPAATVR